MSSFIYKYAAAKTGSTPPPLLIMLHGYGSNEEDLFSFAEALTDRFTVVSLRAPRTLPWGGYAWYDIDFMATDGRRFGNPGQAMNAVKEVAAFISEASRNYHTDPAKTVLLGFSQGAITSYAVSLHYPQLVQHVVAMSGYIFEDIMPQTIHPSVTQHLDFFMSHGTQDEVIPVAWARQADAWLSAHQLKHSYTEYTMGHGINPECFAAMLAWLQARYPARAAR